jgi:ATP-dependent DNA ligase
MVKIVIEEEGEGLIVQRSDSLYEPGRTPSLIKLKVLFLKLKKMQKYKLQQQKVYMNSTKEKYNNSIEEEGEGLMSDSLFESGGTPSLIKLKAFF